MKTIKLWNVTGIPGDYIGWYNDGCCVDINDEEAEKWLKKHRRKSKRSTD